MFDMTSRTPLWLLSAILGLHLLLVFVAHPFIEGSDDIAYAGYAWRILNGDFQLTSHPFSHRFSALVPTALFFGMFGVNPYSSVLWSLISALLQIVVVFVVAYRLAGLLPAIISGFMLAVNPFQLHHSLHLNPDIVLSLFMFLSLAFFYEGRRTEGVGNRAVFGFLSVFCFSVGLVGKLPIVWILPFFLFFLVRDLLRGGNGPFWFAAIPTGLILGGMFLLSYYLATGDPFYRITGIENLQNVETLTAKQVSGYYINKPISVIWPRLTYQPAVLILSTPGLLMALLSNLPLLIPVVRRRMRLPEGVGYWGGALVIFLSFYWFGSISLKHYNPMTLHGYYLLPILPILTLLGGVVLGWIFGSEGVRDPDRRTVTMVLVVTFLTMTGVLALMKAYKFVALVMAAPLIFYLLWGVVFGKTRWFWKGAPAAFAALFMFCITIVPVLLIQREQLGERAAQAAEREILTRVFEDMEEKTIVLTNRRSMSTVSYYLGFPSEDRLAVKNWSHPTPGNPSAKSRRLVFVNLERLRAVHSSYGRKMPPFAKNPPDGWRVIATRDGVTLYDIGDMEIPPAVE